MFFQTPTPLDPSPFQTMHDWSLAFVNFSWGVLFLTISVALVVIMYQLTRND